jgi:hypothetical protein
MVSEVERLSHEVEALRARVKALERRIIPEVELPEGELRELQKMRDEAKDRDYVPVEEIFAKHGKRRE